MKRKKFKGAAVSRLFLAFLAMVFLVAFLLLLSLRLTLFSEKYMEKQAEKADYYSQLTKEMNKQIENSALGSNIPEGVLSNAVEEAIVKEDMNNYFTAMYHPDTPFSIKNEQQVKSSVTEKIKQYAAENNIDLTAESDEAVKLLADQTATVYKGYIELPFLLSFGNRVMAYSSKLWIFMAVCGVLWIVLSVILFRSLRGYLHRLLRYWEYIFVGGGLMMAVIPALILLSGYLKRIGIQSKAMYDFIQAYLSSFLWMFIYMGIGSILIGVGVAVWSEYQRKHLFSQ
ncbi:hypothetical protein ACYSNR_11150 [Enterococcus sp. LJL128]|uniref:hypothetical protein n=1 Tax=Enterococcus sp. LJL51 TaxID=3416656 RepID=UPI003CF0DAE8